LPLVGVGHIESHIAANYLTFPELEPPFIGLIVSGGHTEIVYVENYDCFKILGKTRDDAAGEAIDKIARVIGLGYPGGPKMDLVGQGGNIDKYSFPKTIFKDSLDFSFSGIKTSALNMINQLHMNGQDVDLSDFAASYQNAISEVLVDNSINACIRHKCYNLCMAGGVSANTFLRSRITERAKEEGIQIYFPPVRLCTDNASMVASAGYYSYRKGFRDNLSMNAYPSYSFKE
jgi:N6-L-threonylcarbamoyladenine synthase